MLWAVYCIDKPNTLALRAQHLASHREYLTKNARKIFFSGPLQTDDAATNVGSLWILSVPSRAEAQAFVDNEDFYRAGVFASVTIHRIRQGFFHPDLGEPNPA
jgi:uncharacterized protein YciI